MHEQVEKHLLELALRPQHIERLILREVPQLNAASFPFVLAELHQVAQQKIQLDGLSLGVLRLNEGNQPGDDRRSPPGFRGDYQQLVPRRRAGMLFKRRIRHAGDGFKGRLQVIHDPGNQPPDSGQFLAARKLLAERPLLEQLNR